MANRTADEEADRMMQLLDVGLDALRNGDGDTAILALQETLKTAQRLPQRQEVICLPDLTAGA